MRPQAPRLARVSSLSPLAPSPHPRQPPPAKRSAFFKKDANRLRVVPIFHVPKHRFPGRVAVPSPFSISKSSVPRPDLYYLLPPVQLPEPRGAPPQVLARSAMASHVQILSAPTADTGPSLLLHFDNRRYVFGYVSEGTTRALTQQKIALKMVEDVFVAGEVTWETVGGLFGMIMCLADTASSSQGALEEVNEARRRKGRQELEKSSRGTISIHAGQHLNYVLALARNFVFRKGLPLRPRAIRIGADGRSQDPAGVAPDWEDANIRVWYVPLVSQRLGFGQGRDYSALEQDRPLLPKEVWHQGETVDQITDGIIKDMFGDGYSFDVLRGYMLHDAPRKAEIYVQDGDDDIKPYEGPRPGGAEPCPNIPVLVRERRRANAIDHLPRIEGKAVGDKANRWAQSMCYIVKNKERRGKFEVETAKKLGVNPPDFKKLANNEEVRAKDGSIVTPDMVLAPPRKGHGFAVVSIPSERWVESFLERPEWSNPEIMDGIEAMYWMRSARVQSDPRIIEFRNRFPSLRHILLDHETGPNRIAMEAPATQLVQLSKIDPARFVVPVFNNVPSWKITEEQPNLHIGQPGSTLQLAPVVKFEDDKALPFLDTRSSLEEVESNLKVLSLASEAQTKVAEAAEQLMPDPETEIVTLGTGSALPGKYRNVAATLVRVPGQGSWLFDCGENTMGQIRRKYGKDGAVKVLEDLRGIYISHLHADHHLGTLTVIDAWRRANHPKFIRGGEFGGKRLAVVAPRFYLRFLDEYKDIANYGRQFLIFADTTPRSFKGPDDTWEPWRRNAQVDARAETQPSYELPKVEVCKVDHCSGATAVVFTWPSGLRVAYSGDCRPCGTFARMAKGADLMIHECTFGDDLRDDAVVKKHSTLSEALAIGRDMEARHVLLTHFSQRYPKVADFPDAARALIGDRPVLFGFDGMQVRLGDFRAAELYLPAIRQLYEDKEAVRQAEHAENTKKSNEEKAARKDQSKKGKGKNHNNNNNNNKNNAGKPNSQEAQAPKPQDDGPASDSSVLEGELPRKRARTDE